MTSAACFKLLSNSIAWNLRNRHTEAQLLVIINHNAFWGRSSSACESQFLQFLIDEKRLKIAHCQLKACQGDMRSIKVHYVRTTLIFLGLTSSIYFRASASSLIKPLLPGTVGTPAAYNISVSNFVFSCPLFSLRILYKHFTNARKFVSLHIMFISWFAGKSPWEENRGHTRSMTETGYDILDLSILLFC